LLRLFFYIIHSSFENNPSKLSNKINELKAKFEKARGILSTVPGIDMSQSEQQDYYETLLKQYKREHELLNSYKEMCKFDITQLEQQPDNETVLKNLATSMTNTAANNAESSSGSSLANNVDIFDSIKTNQNTDSS
jgi:hypothetical protein